MIYLYSDSQADIKIKYCVLNLKLYNFQKMKKGLDQIIYCLMSKKK